MDPVQHQQPTEECRSEDQPPSSPTVDEVVVERSSTTESLISTNSSISSVASDVEENVTVIEKEEPDYKGMYEEYKQRLDEKTEHLRIELDRLGGDLKESTRKTTS